MKICFAHNINSGQELHWINALENAGVEYDLIQLSRNDWLDKITEKNYDLIIAQPHGTLSYQKKLFDERMYIIKNVLGLTVYPEYEGLLIYENKRLLSYWLKANSIPHPSTHVFYNQGEATDFIKHAKLPVVAKSNIGASGSGVHILKTKEKAIQIIYKTFKGRGFPQRSGPNFNKKGVYKRILSGLTNIRFVKDKINYYKQVSADREHNCIIFQEFIEHDFEWRCVRIGDSYFAHKKMVKGKYASGTLEKEFSDPPKSLLDFVEKITDKRGLTSTSLDLYETGRDEYLVNEIQTYFGQAFDFQMKVDGKTGRYRKIKEQWNFEEGDFNSNNSCDLRLEHAIHLYETGQLD